MATDLIPIQEVQMVDVQKAIRRAAKDGLNASVLEDFLASVDWSDTAGQGLPQVANVLGQLEELLTQYREGHLTKEQLLEQLNTAPALSRPSR